MKKDLVGTLYLNKIPSDVHIGWVYQHLEEWDKLFNNAMSFNFNVKNSDLTHYTEYKLSLNFMGIVNNFIIGKVTKHVEGGIYLFGIDTEDVSLLGTVFIEHKGSSFITRSICAFLDGDFEEYAEEIRDSENSCNFFALVNRCPTTGDFIKYLVMQHNKHCNVKSKFKLEKLPKHLELDYNYTHTGEFRLNNLIGGVLSDPTSLNYLEEEIEKYMTRIVGEEEDDNVLYLFNSVSHNLLQHEVTPERDLAYYIYTYRHLILSFVLILDAGNDTTTIGVIGIYKNLTHMSYLGSYPGIQKTPDDQFDLRRFLKDLFNK